MTALRHAADPDRADRRTLVARALRPFVDGTAPGMASSQITEARVAATARDAAEAVLPLLGSPARSAHRVRGLIVPAIVCGWPELDEVFERVVDKLLALPPAHPDVIEPAWDEQLAEPKAPEPRVSIGDATEWSSDSREGDTVTGPGGTTGVLVRADRRHALIVEDGRPVRAHSRCNCDPALRRRPSAMRSNATSARPRRRILDVRAGHACPLCRAPVETQIRG
jgi:hypothetical protein